MKIKTITCHNVYNYGASLQAYALQHFLEEQGHDVEIIDFQPYFHQDRYNLFYIGKGYKYYNISAKYPFLKPFIAMISNRKMFQTYGRKKFFDKFTNTFLHLTTHRYETTEELRKIPPTADIYIAGSDQIWNTNCENGLEPAYYLDFGQQSIKRISYAASFAISEIQPEYKSFVSNQLQKFDKISVREQTGLDILTTLGISDGHRVLDPVFLLTSEEWTILTKNAHTHKLKSNKFIVVYDFLGDEKIAKLSKTLKNNFNLPIVSVNDACSRNYADININDAGPLEFLWLIKNAHTVIASSFHATAFSIIFNKDFYIYPLKGQSSSSRMIDLLGMLGLSERFLSEKPLNSIDYSNVNRLIENEIYNSKSFLIDSTTITTNY